MSRSRMMSLVSAVALIAPMWGALAGAQIPDSSRPTGRGQKAAQRGARLPLRPGGGRAGRGGLLDTATASPQQLVQRAFQNRVRRQLNLDQPKMRQLNQTEARFNRERHELNQSERQTRLALRAAMEDTTARDQAKIDQYMNQLIQATRKRADLVEAEYKELSTFLTPMQRAQYLALREQLQKRLKEVNARGAGRGGATTPPGPPPPT